MIEKMTHYTFLVYHRDYDRFLERVRELGVLHVTPTREGNLVEDSDFQHDVQRNQQLQKTLDEMKALLGNETAAPAPAAGGATGLAAADICTRWADFAQKAATLEKNIAELDREIRDLEPWGDFNRDSIDGLKRAGWEVQFWHTEPRNWREAWVKDYNATLITSDKRTLHFITVTPSGLPIHLDGVEQAVISPSPASTLIMLQTRAKDDLKRLRLEQGDFALMHYRPLEDAIRLGREQLDFRQVQLTTAGQAEGRIMLLEGWVPTRDKMWLDNWLDREGYYYQSRPATREDKAPTKFRNSWFTSMYEVLTKMYGMPDYGEFDPTPLLAPFFTLFFAFCMGDAGYGLVLIALGFVLRAKMSPSLRGMMNLVITLGVATTVLGAVFGTFFGMDLTGLSLPESVKGLMVTGKVPGTGYDKMMLVALLIGFVHISIAMTVKAIVTTVRYGWAEAISAWAWLLLVVGFAATGALSFFELISAGVTRWSFIAIGAVAGVGIFLLNNVRRNPLINIGSGLWDTYNMTTGLLGDLLSYVRLYALALAGGMLGGVFNQLAFMAKDGVGVPGLDWLACGLILVLGHALNIAMSCLSAFVHPLRLTFVEYFKNSGYNGQGEEYRPFAKAE